MAKTKLTTTDKIKKHLQAIKKLKEKEKKENEIAPLNFTKELEKIFAKKLTATDYTNILSAVKNNKSNYATYWKLTPTTTTTTTTSSASSTIKK